MVLDLFLFFFYNRHKIFDLSTWSLWKYVSYIIQHFEELLLMQHQQICVHSHVSPRQNQSHCEPWPQHTWCTGLKSVNVTEARVTTRQMSEFSKGVSLFEDGTDLHMDFTDPSWRNFICTERCYCSVLITPLTTSIAPTWKQVRKDLTEVWLFLKLIWCHVLQSSSNQTEDMVIKGVWQKRQTGTSRRSGIGRLYREWLHLAKLALTTRFIIYIFLVPESSWSYFWSSSL